MMYMDKYVELLKFCFDVVLQYFEDGLKGLDMGGWIVLEGGYFILFDCLFGLVKEIIVLVVVVGVKLMFVGVIFFYGFDLEDKNIWFVFSFFVLFDINKIMEVFVVCVKFVLIRLKL